MRRTSPKGYVKSSGHIVKRPASGPPKTIWSGVKPVGQGK